MQVAATIKPVHSLVSAVMSGVGEPQLVIRGMTSPHSFSMRPSDARKLANADVVFLIGEAVETSVFQTMDALAADAEVVVLARSKDIVRRPLRSGGSFEEDHDHDHAHGGRDGDEGEFDAHVWLDPANAQAMARVIAEVLAAADPANAATYADNSDGLEQQLEELSAEIAAAVAPVRGKPFLVFHDAYQHFEDRFGLTAAGSAIVATDRSPGVRRIRQLRAKVKDLDVRCLMAEPQFDPRLVHVIAQGTDAGIGEVDPLGAAIKSGPEHYFTLLREMAASFRSCLSPD